MPKIKLAISILGYIVLEGAGFFAVSMAGFSHWLGRVSPRHAIFATGQTVMEKGGVYITASQSWWLMSPFIISPIAAILGVMLVVAGGHYLEPGISLDRYVKMHLATIGMIVLIIVTPIWSYIVAHFEP